jgi:hypothetical protein
MALWIQCNYWIQKVQGKRLYPEIQSETDADFLIQYQDANSNFLKILTDIIHYYLWFTFIRLENLFFF